MKSCHRCHAAWDEPGEPGFNNTCSKCGMALHACANCVHFVPRGSVRCLVPNVAIVQDPLGSNRCLHFDFARAGQIHQMPAGMPAVAAAPKTTNHFQPGKINDPVAARRHFEQLFGG